MVILILVLSSALTADGSELSRAEAPVSGLPLLFEINLVSGFTATGNEPETALRVDPDVEIIDPNTGLLNFGAEAWNINSLLRPREPSRYGTVALAIAAEWEVAPWFLTRGLFDTGELRDGSTLDPAVGGLTSSGRSIDDELGSGAFVRELVATFTTDAVSFEIGRRRSAVARGLVYDDYGTGASLYVDFEPLGVGPASAELFAVAVGRRFEDLEKPSPLLALRVDWHPSLFESVGVFAAGFVDRSDHLTDIIGSAIAEQVIVSDRPSIGQQLALDEIFFNRRGEGRVGYVGVQGNIIVADKVGMRGAAVASAGYFDIEAPTGERRLLLRGFAADAEVHYGLSSHLDIGAFGFVLSGGDPPGRGTDTYRGFIGVAPYWVWSGLFFSGGLSQGLYAGRATASGVNGHGVIGGGPTVEVSNDLGLVEVRLLYLGAMVGAPQASLGGDGMSYGFELDIWAEGRFTDWLTVGVELDVLRPGNYFPSQKLAYRTIARLSLHYAK